MKKNDKTTQDSPTKLLDDLRALVSEAEKLIHKASSKASIHGDHESLRDRFDRTQLRIEELYTDTKTRVASVAKSADASVRANPYQSLAIAAGIGLLVGAVTGRGNSK
ncbi:hypothetical protein [Pelagicoccus sp. SDUM812003]|uniref:DUF883 family protein n=1 Tax=Pelagicoccus sp. SDUM812003 TaxID=3041267 RepID=UPI00280E3BB2|nr:hypothetical protein [Pelagicoccus sp. SDUM812003]MDQ8204721.1 hypothetical protein [Pelagicoccus sp. SDUM812003]